MSGVLVDARGLRCPWPVLRLARAMGDAAEAEIVADDPAAAREIAALAAARGWRVETVAAADPPRWRVFAQPRASILYLPAAAMPPPSSS